MGSLFKQLSYNQDIHRKYKKKPTKKLFRSARMTERRAHQGIKEAECLRSRPVPGIATWYEKVGNQGETKVFLQKIGCGDFTEIHLSEQYPNILPKEFELLNAKNLRDYSQLMKQQGTTVQF